MPFSLVLFSKVVYKYLRWSVRAKKARLFHRIIAGRDAIEQERGILPESAALIREDRSR